MSAMVRAELLLCPTRTSRPRGYSRLCPMGRKDGRSITPYRWPIAALKLAALDRHGADRAVIPLRLQNTAERVRAPVHALATGGAPHGETVSSPGLLPAECRVTVETVAGD